MHMVPNVTVMYCLSEISTCVVGEFGYTLS